MESMVDSSSHFFSLTDSGPEISLVIPEVAWLSPRLSLSFFPSFFGLIDFHDAFPSLDIDECNVLRFDLICPAQESFLWFPESVIHANAQTWQAIQVSEGSAGHGGAVL